MERQIDGILRDYLALRGESPDLLPVLADGEDSAVLTLADQLKARLLPAAVEATATTPEALMGDAARLIVRTAGEPYLPRDYLKPYGRDRYIPFPTFDGETLVIAEAAYRRMLKVLVS